MTARIIDGKAIAAELRAAVAAEVQRLTREHGLEPGLAVVLVGENPASAVYVGGKQKASAEEEHFGSCMAEWTSVQCHLVWITQLYHLNERGCLYVLSTHFSCPMSHVFIIDSRRNAYAAEHCFQQMELIDQC